MYEDPRIAQVAAVLPQANCGGCGYPGCSGFADACVKAGSLEGKLCPVGGQPVMTKVAEILGLDAAAAEPMVAVVRCNGTVPTVPVSTNMTVQRVVRLHLLFMVVKQDVVLAAWVAVTVWMLVSSMLST